MAGLSFSCSYGLPLITGVFALCSSLVACAARSILVGAFIARVSFFVLGGAKLLLGTVSEG